MKRVVAALLAAAAAAVQAQPWPAKPPKIVVGYPPGGSGDFTTRLIADELSKEFGVAFVVENRPGAGGSIASEFVARAAPDGYTILNQGNHAIARLLYKDVKYDDRDFIPVSRIANGATVLVVN
ncbi:MAG: tripartite tricarboxylate transporter substrate-binding protein, partial [Burkholderiales bacterium]|nr:tripartite tricarboxylate transporter substrate-binding protein [Burkholderiales bacterium]